MKNDALNLCNPFIFSTRGKVLSFIMVYQDYTIENDQCLCAANIEREGDEFERIPPSISQTTSLLSFYLAYLPGINSA